MLPLLLYVQLAASAPLQSPSLIDLSYKLGNDTIYWPGAESFRLTIGNRGPSGVLPWYEGNFFSAAEHGGTHMDAPAHFSQEKWRVDDIPVERLVGPALVVDIRDKTAKNRDYLLSAGDLQDWELRHGKIDDGSIVLVLTGWHRFYGNRTLYLGNENNDAQNLHFPGISLEAAKWLVNNRTPYGVGLDTASLDHGPSRNFSTHQTLFAANIYGLENVARLDQLPIRGAMLYVSVINIEDGSGAPVRLIAVLNSTTSAVKCNALSVLLFFSCAFSALL